MDSINRNQSEDTHKHLSGAHATNRIREMAEDAKSCFFCTNAPQSETRGTRPMGVEKVDEEGHLWFLSAADSHKNREIEADSQVRIFMQGSKHSGFLVLDGTATIHRDPALIDELWDPIMKTWFTGGKDDPRITVIEVAPVSGYYWDTKHGSLVAATKMVIGAAIGKTLDDSVEGQLRP
jgi:general stress protein 26